MFFELQHLIRNNNSKYFGNKSSVFYVSTLCGTIRIICQHQIKSFPTILTRNLKRSKTWENLLFGNEKMNAQLHFHTKPFATDLVSFNFISSIFNNHCISLGLSLIANLLGGRIPIILEGCECYFTYLEVGWPS